MFISSEREGGDGCWTRGGRQKKKAAKAHRLGLFGLAISGHSLPFFAIFFFAIFGHFRSFFFDRKKDQDIFGHVGPTLSNFRPFITISNAYVNLVVLGNCNHFWERLVFIFIFIFGHFMVIIPTNYKYKKNSSRTGRYKKVKLNHKLLQNYRTNISHLIGWGVVVGPDQPLDKVGQVVAKRYSCPQKCTKSIFRGGFGPALDIEVELDNFGSAKLREVEESPSKQNALIGMTTRGGPGLPFVTGRKMPWQFVHSSSPSRLVLKGLQLPPPQGTGL